MYSKPIRLIITRIGKFRIRVFVYSLFFKTMVSPMKTIHWADRLSDPENLESVVPTIVHKCLGDVVNNETAATKCFELIRSVSDCGKECISIPVRAVDERLFAIARA